MAQTYRRCKAAMAMTALALWLVVLAGCAPIRLPAIDPTGERIFLPAPASTTLALPDASKCQIPRPQPAFTVPPDPEPCPEATPAAPGATACGGSQTPKEGRGLYGPNSGEKLG